MSLNDQDLIDFFQQALLDWHSSIERPMPWKDSKDPYKIWLSEIILQQTRLAQGIPYYEKFLAHYPTVHDLAQANLEEVLKLWQGLGYYNRARSLHYTAQMISERDGVFPDNHKELLKLKGVGPYTAAAIASFAFDLPHAVVDGNVIRVLSRLLGITDPVDSRKTRVYIEQKAQEFLLKNDPGAYNQALMDFGATVCTPHNPNCEVCPVITRCQAMHQKMVDKIPVKLPKVKKAKEHMHYLVLTGNNRMVLRKRPSTGIWPDLYEPILLPYNQSKKITPKTLKSLIPEELNVIVNPIINTSSYKHILTHKVLVITYYHVHIADLRKDIGYSLQEAHKLPHPRILDKYFQEMGFFKDID